MSFHNCPAARYIDSLKSHVDRQCVHSRLRTIAAFHSANPSVEPIGYGWSSLQVDDLTRIYYWIAALTNRSAHHKRNLISALRGVLKHCVWLGHMDANDYNRLAMQMKTPKVPTSAGRFIEHTEIKALFAAVADTADQRVRARDTAILAVAFFQALRHAEMRNLNIGDVSLHRQTLAVRGKGDTYNIMPLHPATLVALENWLQIYDLSKDMPAKDWNEKPLFISLKTRRWQDRLVRVPDNTLKALPRQWAKRANIEPFTWHDARRTHASTLFDCSKVDPYTVSKLLRHARLATTQAYDLRGAANLRPALNTLSFGLPIEEHGTRRAAELRNQTLKADLAGQSPTTTDPPQPDPLAVLLAFIDDRCAAMEQRFLSWQQTSAQPRDDDPSSSA